MAAGCVEQLAGDANPLHRSVRRGLSGMLRAMPLQQLNCGGRRLIELRWNPLLRTWTMVAPGRQGRPVAEGDSGGCPFCPGSGKVPDGYDVLAYDNDFPALSRQATEPSRGNPPYLRAPAYGQCEVILYSSSHEASLADLPVSQVRRLVELWVERFSALSSDERVKYVFIFENRGPEVGVTVSHPHGQVYAYPFVPLKIQIELESCRAYRRDTGRCLICDMNREESRFGARVVYENEDFVGYIPFFTDYPYGLFLVPKEHVTFISDLSSRARDRLAEALRDTVGAFDLLFDRPFPYMMNFHQGPVNSPEYRDAPLHYHFHIEFYPPLREADKIKFYASSEMGAWAACNPARVEETAGHLRDAYVRFRSGP